MGAPYDAFLSADQARPRSLSEQGLASEPISYAIGHLVLWGPKLNLEEFTLHGRTPIPTALLQMSVKKVSIANPLLAPYGLAAQQVLEELNLLERSQNKLVRGENIAQAYQFVHSGNAEMGFIALAQARSLPEDSRIWKIPDTLHAPIKQDAVLLKKGADNAAAKAFMKFLVSQEGQTIIHRFGYSMPRQY